MTAPPERLSPLVVPPLGRATEAAAALEAMSDLAVGRGGVLVLYGDAGVGKTTLARWMLDDAAERGWGHAMGRGFELAGDTPYAAIVPVLHALCSTVAAERTRRLAGLSSLALVLDGIDVPASSVPLDPQLARTRLHHAIVTLLDRATDDCPHVVVIDDLQWADPATIEVLQPIVAEIESQALLLVLTVRTDTSAVVGTLPGLIDRWRRAVSTRVLTVSGLADDDVAEMVARQLGTGLPVRLVQLVWERTAGIPLLVEATLDDLRATGALRVQSGRWVLTSAEPPVGRLADELLVDRIDRLAPGARRVLQVVSLAGEPVDATGVSEVAGLGADDAERLLHELREQGLVDLEWDADGVGRWEPHHPLLGDAALGMLDHPSREELHRRFLDVLGEDEPARRARHLLGLGELDGVPGAVGMLEAAARAALDRGAAIEAVNLARPALGLAERGHEPHRLVQLHLLLGDAWHRRDEPELALGHLRSALELAEAAGDRMARLAALRLADLTGSTRGPTQPFEAEVHRLFDEVSALGDDRLLVEVGHLAYSVEARAGRSRSHPRAQQVIAVMQPAVERLGDERSRLLAEMVELFTFGHGPSMRARHELARGLARRAEQHPDLRGRFLHSQLDWALRIGDRRLIEEAAAAELEHGRLYGTTTWRVAVARWFGHLADGNFDRAAETQIPSSDDRWARLIGYLAGLRATALLVGGEREVALDEVREARTRLDAAPLPDPPSLDLLDAVELLITLDATLAERVISRSAESWELSGVSVLPLVAQRVAYSVAGRAEEGRALSEHMRDLDDDVTLSAVFADVLDALDGNGDRDALLRRARAGFETLGLPAGVRWVDGLSDGTTSRADPASRTTTPGPGELTPREREVAEAVAEGLTNREVAEQLFISVRTVSTHLERVYAKLGISGRRELRQLVRDQARWCP